MMVIGLGGLQSIPDDFYEMAEVDGAVEWFHFGNITAPLLRPVMIPALPWVRFGRLIILYVIWLVSERGEPGDSTDILVSYVLQKQPLTSTDLAGPRRYRS